jgi:uncharacterized protein (DUF433 family)
MKFGAVSSEKDSNGKVVFENTNVPVQTFFEYLEDDKSMEKFLNDYPAVNKTQTIEVLQMAKVLMNSEEVLKKNFPTHD